MTSLLRALAVPLVLASLTTALLLASPSHAATAERFTVELRVIEAVPGEGKQEIDKRLATFAKDLKALPFRELKLLDSHTTGVREGERVSLEIPGGKAKKRFLQVAAHGRQAGGKLRFQLSIDAMKFDTLVAVPNGGTIFVALPKGKGPAMIIAFTARSS